MIQKINFMRNYGRVLNNFPEYHRKILLGDFNVKVGRKITFKRTIGNESLRTSI